MRRHGRTIVASGLVATVAVVATGWWLLAAPAPTEPELAGAVQRESLNIGGRTRTFSTYFARRGAPAAGLVFVLHGSMMSGARMRAATVYEFDVLADREGFIVVYPDGYGGYWNDCRAIGDFAAKSEGVDDVAFLRAIAERLVKEHDIPKRRVFATGVSNGGQMAYRLAFEAPDLVGAIAPIAASVPSASNQTCEPSSRAVATMIINGTDDPLNPYEGGEVALFGLFMHRGTVQSSLESARYWARLAGYREGPRREPIPDRDPNDGTRSTRWTWAEVNRPEVALIEVEGGGHTIPHPRGSWQRLLGRVSRDFSAPGEIWAFFVRNTS